MICKSCSEDKDVLEFHKGKRHCKACRAIESRIYRRSINGVVARMWSGMKKHSDVRGDRCNVEITKEQFSEWLDENEDVFSKVYFRWADMGYDDNETPTVDRIKSSDGYNLVNMRIVPFSENKNNYYTDMKEKVGINQKLVELECYTLDGLLLGYFASIKDASFFCNLTSTASIRECADGKRRSAGGFIWKRK